jgi:hypothetical protein
VYDLSILDPTDSWQASFFRRSRARRASGWLLAACWSQAAFPGCSSDALTYLHATRGIGGGGGSEPLASEGGTGGTNGIASGRNPFCNFAWGRQWAGRSPTTNTPPSPDYPDNLDFLSVWVGYESDDGMNQAIVDLLGDLSPGGTPSLQGVIPVYYAYFVAFKSLNRMGLGGCAPESTTPNLCTEGAQWIVDNRDYLRQVYDDYARRTAAIWGTERPILWLLEPDFTDYIRPSQSNPLTLQELAALASDLISTIRARLPNALIALYASAQTTDYASYFGAFELSLVSFVYTTGWSVTGALSASAAEQNPSATYQNLHAATGLPIFVDTGFGATLIADTWTTAEASAINARIAEGVSAVNIEPPTSAMAEQVDALGPQLTPLCPSH